MEAQNHSTHAARWCTFRKIGSQQKCNIANCVYIRRFKVSGNFVERRIILLTLPLDLIGRHFHRNRFLFGTFCPKQVICFHFARSLTNEQRR